jgi:integrase
VWLAKTELDIVSDQWLDPAAGAMAFGNFATAWIAERPNLRPKTIELYDYLLRCHLAPTFGAVALADIREPTVRRWRKQRLDSGVAAVTLAKAYRLLKAIMETAVDDGAIRRNPCRIRGGGQESSPERPILTVSQVFDLADAIGQRYRALVLLGSFGSLRWGELAALRRSDIDLAECTVRVDRTLIELQNGQLSLGPPKSAAGRRTVVFPEPIVPELRSHLDRIAESENDGLVFVGPGGASLRRTNFRQRVWLPALKAAGLPAMHFHDLRHTGNALTANAGANLRELMARMGHSSTRAALIYLHSTDERQREIAASLGHLVRAGMPAGKNVPDQGPSTRPTGTQRARRTANPL